MELPKENKEFEPLEAVDQEIVDSLVEMPKMEVSPSFKKEVWGRIEERQAEGKSGRILSSPWQRCRPWILWPCVISAWQ